MFRDFPGRGHSDLSLTQEPLFCIPFNSPISEFLIQKFIMIRMSVRSVALLLDVGFQKQTRVFFHPLSNDASTGSFQELHLQVLEDLIVASLWMSGWLFSNFVLMLPFETLLAFALVCIQVSQQKTWTSF